MARLMICVVTDKAPFFHFFLSISCYSQCSTTGVTKAMVCVILSGMVHIKEPLLLISHVVVVGFLLLSEWSFRIYHMSDAI